MCHCFLLYSAKSSAKTRSFKHCLRIEYNPKAVAPADAKLIRCKKSAHHRCVEEFAWTANLFDCESRRDSPTGVPERLAAALPILD
jgi:hypothetical protein